MLQHYFAPQHDDYPFYVYRHRGYFVHLDYRIAMESVEQVAVVLVRCAWRGGKDVADGYSGFYTDWRDHKQHKQENQEK